MQPVWERSPAIRYGIAVVAVSLATLVRAAFHAATSERAPFVVFAVAVVIAAWLGGFRPGLLAAILASIAGIWMFFAYHPTGRYDLAEFSLPLLFFLLCLLIAAIIGRMHATNQRLRTAQRELLGVNQRLRASNEDLECFAHATSHDLQEPLRMVAVYSELLVRENKGKFDAESEQFAAYIEEGVARMRTLIDDILAFSRLSVGDDQKALGPADSGEALRVALRSLDAAIRESGADIDVGSLPAVQAEAGRLAQVFQNLIGNAIKYRGDAPPRIAISATREGELWTFNVQDNGIGVHPRYHEQIFGIFSRLHTANEYPGTGIGLAISKRIVERTGGRLWVESKPGEGATFRFTVPAAEAEARLPARTA